MVGPARETGAECRKWVADRAGKGGDIGVKERPHAMAPVNALTTHGSSGPRFRWAGAPRRTTCAADLRSRSPERFLPKPRAGMIPEP